jgi:transmembrane sensor
LVDGIHLPYTAVGRRRSGNKNISYFMKSTNLFIADEAAAWFARLRRDDLSEHDLREFEAWKRRSRKHEEAWAEMCALWNDPAIMTALGAVIPSPSRPRCVIRRSLFRRPLITTAAAAAVAIVLLFIVLASRDVLLQFQADYRTASGEQRRLQLQDGSTVTLNTKTAIATEFDGPTRRVRLLVGEAFFAVSPDPRKPFLVESRNVVTRALGTAFVVKEQGNGLQVAVIEGRVDVRVAGDVPSHVELRAGQQVAITEDRLSLPTPANPELLTAWLQSRLVFDSASLAQVVDELNRYHAGHIVVLGAATRRMHVTGTYHLSNTSAILDTLVQTLPIHKIQLTHRLVLLY